MSEGDHLNLPDGSGAVFIYTRRRIAEEFGRRCEYTLHDALGKLIGSPFKCAPAVARKYAERLDLERVSAARLWALDAERGRWMAADARISKRHEVDRQNALLNGDVRLASLVEHRSQQWNASLVEALGR